MKLLRIILFPFSILYGIITGIRNRMYDSGILQSYTFAIPVIAVGNLSTGGTGKTPQTEYLIRLLSDRYRVATLSRGYKRKSKGFVLADANANADVLGDEPYQFYTKFSRLSVAVDADRKNGIEKLLALPEKPEVVVLDDAFQHRKVEAGFYILLTAYGDIYADDYLLPTGNLREGRIGADRADVIIVTKCPPDLPEKEKHIIIKKLQPKQNQQVYFTFIEYDDKVYSKGSSLAVTDVLSMDVVLVAGIAKPQSFFDRLNGKSENILIFPDHHNFLEKDIENIKERAQQRIIITTEKDYVRLKGKLPDDKLYYLPIKSTFTDDRESFDVAIMDFVGIYPARCSSV